MQGLTPDRGGLLQAGGEAEGQDGEEAEEEGQGEDDGLESPSSPPAWPGCESSKKLTIHLVKKHKKSTCKTANLRRIERLPTRGRCYPPCAGCSPVRYSDLQRLRHLLQT